MTVSRRLRFEIFRRDDFTCRYCGANQKNSPDLALTVDHVIATTLGGSDEPANLVTACQPCNAGKSSVPADASMVEDVENDAVRWAKALAVAAERIASDRESMDVQFDAFKAEWSKWKYGPEHDRRLVPIDSSWRDSIERFMAAGLPMTEICNLVRVAMRSKAEPDETWRYFCGCCWKTITQMQEAARRLIEDGEVA